MLNRIKLVDPDKSVYTIVYIDRFKNLKELKFSDIKKMDDHSIVFSENGEDVEIPLDKVKKVCRKDECLWASPNKIV